MVPLDKNESYWLLTPDLVAKMVTNRSDELSTYPDYASLRQKVAEYAGVGIESVLLTPGSDAAIQTLAYSLFKDGGEALLPTPTFYGYESILERVGATTIPVFYTEQDNEFSFPTEEVLNVLTERQPRALFLCQPNNPLGLGIPSEDIERITDQMKGSESLLVSDEAYYEFSERTMIDRLHSMSNLVIIRTLSKGFGLSGARIGYCIASPEIIRKMERQMLPWPIAHQSASAAEFALTHADLFSQRVRAVRDARSELMNRLREYPEISVYSSETNFVLIRVPDAEWLAKGLREAGILVALGERMSRYDPAKSLLAHTIRMAIPSPEHMEEVLDVFHRAFT